MVPLSKDYVIPYDIWIEIFLRLPLLSLKLFKSVSKHWLSLMTSAYFSGRLQKPRIDPPCGLFIRRENSDYYDFVTLGPKASISITLPLGSHFNIMHSCNGLLFCRSYVSYTPSFHVYNPFTNQFKNISPPPISHSNSIIAFDPTKSPYYKLVSLRMIGTDEGSIYQIQIYSSELGEWRLCGPLYPPQRFMGFSKGLYWNNAIHWINHYDKLHSKFDIVDHAMVTNLQIPSLHNVDYRHTKLFESRGSLLLLMKVSSRHHHVFEMREESSKWSQKYILDDLMSIVPWDRIRHGFHCIVLGEREDDSFMVIESHDSIVRYNFVSKIVSTLCNFVPCDYLTWSCFPIISSLAGV